jgi:hypothetical protein
VPFGEAFVERVRTADYALLVDEGPIARAQLALVVGVGVGVLAAAILHHPRLRGAATSLPGRAWPFALAVLALLHALSSGSWSTFSPFGFGRHALLATTLGHAGLVVGLGALLVVATSALAGAVPHRSLQALAVAALLALLPSVPLHAYAQSLLDVRAYALGLEHGPERVHLGSTVTLRPAHYRVSGPVWIFSGSTSWLDETETGWHPVERSFVVDKAGAL